MGFGLLARNLFHYEAPDDGGGAPAAVAEPTAPSEPAVPEGAAPVAPEAPAAPASEELFQVPREDWERTQYLLGELLEDRRAPQPFEAEAPPEYADGGYGDEQEQYPEGFTLDPLDDNYGPSMAWLIRTESRRAANEAAQQATAPFYERERSAALEEAGARAMDILTDVRNRPGASEFDMQAARNLANSLLPEAASRWGYVGHDEQGRPIAHPRAAEEALTRAAQQLMAIERRAEERGYNRHKAELGALSGAPGSLSAAGAAGVVGQPAATNETELGRSIAQRMRV